MIYCIERAHNLKSAREDNGKRMMDTQKREKLRRNERNEDLGQEAINNGDKRRSDMRVEKEEQRRKITK
jgi:hypothetical protein